MGRTHALLVALALGLALAGCGNGDGDATPEPATEPGAGPPVTAEPEAEPPSGDAPDTVLLDFVDAAREEDAEALFSLLTEETRQRLGPTLEDFRAGPAVELAEGVGAFPEGETERVLVERLEEDLAVVTIAAPRTVEGMRELGAYAAVLHREDGDWRVSLGGGPEVVPLAPEPGTAVRGEVTPAFRVPGDPAEVGLWLDDTPLVASDSPVPPITEQGEPPGPVYGFDVIPPLEPGLHVATAYARDEEGVTARAWTFTVV